EPSEYCTDRLTRLPTEAGWVFVWYAARTTSRAVHPEFCGLLVYQRSYEMIVDVHRCPARERAPNPRSIPTGASVTEVSGSDRRCRACPSGRWPLGHQDHPLPIRA